MKRALMIAGVMILVAGFVGINLVNQASNEVISVDVTTLKEQTLTETVMIPGTLQLAGQQTIYYEPDKGKVGEMLIKEGDEVQIGTPLFRYENPQLELEKKQLALQLRSNNLQLSNIKKQHKKIDKQLVKAESDEMLDKEELQAEHDQIFLEEQQMQIEIEQTLLQQQSIDKQLEELTVKSQSEGVVLRVNEQAAALSQSMEQPIIQIAASDRFVVKGTISQYDALKIKEGQSAILSMDAVPGKVWNGKVTFVSFLPNESEQLEAANEEAFKVQYPIEIAVEDEDLNVKPGFQMLAEINTDKKNGWTLPLSAIKQDGGNQYVFVVKDGRVERQKVKVGMTSSDAIEITGGLSKDDQVIIDPSEALEDGVEVIVNDQA
ncbi:efflux RND transporter periplasmic adaptor subunit [Siminovitchia sp. 179-K 8D1 HS]|uniref:efflux RND transporter periplasmic adaptor subunit n=1 Tax=Siminovitchia sp. 179-K 8D1 HS TaxID=3142385 RepID=UPI0039A0B407